MMTHLQAKLYILYVVPGRLFGVSDHGLHLLLLLSVVQDHLSSPVLEETFCQRCTMCHQCHPLPLSGSWVLPIKDNDKSSSTILITHFVWPIYNINRQRFKRSHVHHFTLTIQSPPDSLHLQKQFDLDLPPHFTAKKLCIRSTNRCKSWKCVNMCPIHTSIPNKCACILLLDFFWLFRRILHIHVSIHKLRKTVISLLVALWTSTQSTPAAVLWWKVFCDWAHLNLQSSGNIGSMAYPLDTAKGEASSPPLMGSNLEISASVTFE